MSMRGLSSPPLAPVEFPDEESLRSAVASAVATAAVSNHDAGHGDDEQDEDQDYNEEDDEDQQDEEAEQDEEDEEDEEDEDGDNVAAFNQLAAMAPQELLQLFAQFALHRQAGQPQTTCNEDLVAHLRQQGELSSDPIERAFLAVDRKTYCVGAEEDNDAYADRPFRPMRRSAPVPSVHLSAPGIYARCLEKLDLRPGLSFLNVGSGTGYLSTIVAQLIGPHAIHHCIEVRPTLVALSTRLATERGLHAIAFHTRSVHAIDVDASMRFDRIWVGAGASLAERTHILRLLRVGGIAVGPFEDAVGEQRLLKATKVDARTIDAMRQARLARPTDSAELFSTCTTTSCILEPLMRVSFSPLLRERHLSEPNASDDVTADALEPIALLGPRWGDAHPSAFPESFVHTVALLALATTRDPKSPCAKLPWDVWAVHILPFLAHDAFEHEAVFTPSLRASEAEADSETLDDGCLPADVLAAMRQLTGPQLPAPLPPTATAAAEAEASSATAEDPLGAALSAGPSANDWGGLSAENLSAAVTNLTAQMAAVSTSAASAADHAAAAANASAFAATAAGP